MVEEEGCDVLLLGREVGQRAFDVVADDLLRSAKPLESGESKLVRAGVALLVPQPSQHEL